MTTPTHRRGVSRRQSIFLTTAAALAACDRRGRASGQTVSGSGLGQTLSDPMAKAFYVQRGGQAAWDQAKARALTNVIAGAQAHGLDPAAFALKPATGVGQDEALTLAALAYAKALAFGFMDPHRVERVFTLERNRPDLAAGLTQALDGGGLEAWFGALAPQDAEYKALSAAYLSALQQAGLRAPPTQGAPVGSSMAPADQMRQLAANLERRRWLSRIPPTHRIDVNTAGCFLGYFKNGQQVSSAKTVVGRDDHPTPSIQAAFRRLIANPPWRVPSDIAAKEILPKGSAYMRREDMHMVAGRVIQAPGPKSALGRVKFDVEDPYDIYLHDTPSKSLFALNDRHRSHGCVRVENAVDFAQAIAAETGKADALEQALASQDTQTVELGQSIGVRMLYHTAYLNDSGQVQLAPDVYGSDDALATALGLHQSAAAHRRTEPQVLFGP